MKRILGSVGMLAFVGAIVLGATGAFFTDTETSTGNTFTAGAIDLKIDNESYVTNAQGQLVYSESTSWGLSDLTDELFFNFDDLKPGDRGEDTISLHINNNDAYACMDVAITSTPENDQTEPEAEVDDSDGEQEGELQDQLYIAFWADDGDNVYEAGENIFQEGTLATVFAANNQKWALADSQNNVWGLQGPLQGASDENENVYYIAKYWCFGVMGESPVVQDEFGKTGSNGPLQRGTGFTCNGASVGNETQTDGVMVDVSFEAVQSRNNNEFLCNPAPQPEPTTMVLFEDDFNSYTDGALLNSGNTGGVWTEAGGARSEGKTGNADPDLVADFNGSSPQNDGDDELIETLVTISTLGKTNITIAFDWRTFETEAGDDFVAEYSVDGGSTWHQLAVLHDDTPWTSESFSSLSPSADNIPNLKLRFRLQGSADGDHGQVDNIVVTGFGI